MHCLWKERRQPGQSIGDWSRQNPLPHHGLGGPGLLSMSLASRRKSRRCSAGRAAPSATKNSVSFPLWQSMCGRSGLMWPSPKSWLDMTRHWKAPVVCILCRESCCKGVEKEGI